MMTTSDHSTVTKNKDIKLKDIEISHEFLTAELNIAPDEFEAFGF